MKNRYCALMITLCSLSLFTSIAAYAEDTYRVECRLLQIKVVDHHFEGDWVTLLSISEPIDAPTPHQPSHIDAQSTATLHTGAEFQLKVAANVIQLGNAPPAIANDFITIEIPSMGLSLNSYGWGGENLAAPHMDYIGSGKILSFAMNAFSVDQDYSYLYRCDVLADPAPQPTN